MMCVLPRKFVDQTWTGQRVSRDKLWLMDDEVVSMTTEEVLAAWCKKTGTCPGDVLYEVESPEDIMEGLQVNGHAQLAYISGPYPEYNNEVWSAVFCISGRALQSILL